MSVDNKPSLKRCCWVDLPRELRDQIYDLAIEDKHVIFTPRRRIAPHMPVQRIDVPTIVEKLLAEENARPVPKDQAEPPTRLFRGLTQVNREIRREFLPLYTAKTTYRILHVDIPEFLETVLQAECLRDSEYLIPDPLVDCIDMKKYNEALRSHEGARRQQMTRELIMDCAPLNWRVWKKGSGHQEPTVDVLPFLKFIATAPNVRVRCGFSACICCSHDWAGMVKNINVLFEVAKRPKLVAWLEIEVERVEVTFPPRLIFEMKEGYYKDWMEMWGLDGVTDDPDMRSWMDDVGIEVDRTQHGSWQFRSHEPAQ